MTDRTSRDERGFGGNEHPGKSVLHARNISSGCGPWWAAKNTCLARPGNMSGSTGFIWAKYARQETRRDERSGPMPGRFGSSPTDLTSRGARKGGALFKLVAFLAVIFAFVALAWMLFLPVLLTTEIRRRTGFDASIKQLAVNPLTATISLQGLVLSNPPTFPVTEFLEVRNFQANAEVFSLFTDRPTFATMTVDIAKVTLVKGREGRTNAQAFQRNLETSRDGGPRPPSSAVARNILVRRLHLQIDRMVIADHSFREPRTREYTLGINQRYVDVTDLAQLAAPKVLQELAPVAAAAGELLPENLGRMFGDAAKSGAAAVKDVGRNTTEKAKRFFDALEESKKP